MKKYFYIAAGIVILLSSLVFGQDQNKSKFSLEFNPGVSSHLNKIDNSGSDIGVGFEGILHYQIDSDFGVFVGWGWNRFNIEKTFAGTNNPYEETGYIIGAQYKLTLKNSNYKLFFRAAALYNHIEIENSDGQIAYNTGHGLGFQAAAGIEIPVGYGWSINPGVKFNLLNRNLDLAGISKEISYNYISLRVGISKNL